MFLFDCFQVKSEVCLSPDHLLSPSLSPQSSSYAASSSGGMAATNTNSSTTINNNIKFGPLLPQKWCKVYDANLQVLKLNSQTIIGWYCHRIPRWRVNMYFLTFFQEMPTPKLVVVADKGFNFSTIDDSFIVQKKNHFQVFLRKISHRDYHSVLSLLLLWLVVVSW